MSSIGEALSETGEVKSYRRDKRRRGRSRRRSPKLGLLVGALMTFVLGGFLVAKAAQWYSGTLAYAGIALGSSPAEVRYALGEPSTVRTSTGEAWLKASNPQNFSQWRYSTPLLEVRFEEGSGRVQSIVCDFDAKLSRMPCPPALGVNVQDEEASVVEKLGRPSSEYIQGGRKVMRYEETGYEFVLEQLRVRSIRATRTETNFAASTVRFLIWLIP